MKGHFSAITLIVIGLIALGVNLDVFELDLVALLRKWWPLALVALSIALYLTPDKEK